MDQKTYLDIIFKARNQLIKTVKKQTGGQLPPVVDSIFFPELNVDPLVRIDGSMLSEKKALELEKASPFIIVRLPKYIPHLTKKFFTILCRWAKNYSLHQKNRL